MKSDCAPKAREDSYRRSSAFIRGFNSSLCLCVSAVNLAFLSAAAAVRISP
jgi:hypothetical protein